MTEEILKPCPFCGNKTVHYVYNIEMEPDGITCFNCHVIVRFPRIKEKGERFEVAMGKMADIWNQREGDS